MGLRTSWNPMENIRVIGYTKEKENQWIGLLGLISEIRSEQREYFIYLKETKSI